MAGLPNGWPNIFKGAGLALGAMLSLGAKAPTLGQPAPPFELTLMDGSKVSSQSLRGQVVMLNFWATWCVPCKRELPLLDRYYDLQKSRGLKIFAITTEDSVPLHQLKKLFAVMHIPPTRRIKGKYDILGGVPTNYVIDRAGRIRYAKAAAFDLDSLNDVLVPLLREPVPQDAVVPDPPAR